MINKIRNLLKNIKLKKSKNQEEFDEQTGEFVIDPIEENDEFQSDGYDATATNINQDEYLDINDSKLSVKDRINQFTMSLKDKFKRLNKICFNISNDKNANIGEKSNPNFVGGIKFLNG